MKKKIDLEIFYVQIKSVKTPPNKAFFLKVTKESLTKLFNPLFYYYIFYIQIKSVQTPHIKSFFFTDYKKSLTKHFIPIFYLDFKICSCNLIFPTFNRKYIRLFSKITKIKPYLTNFYVKSPH